MVKSLKDLMDAEDQKWLRTITDCDDTGVLQKKLISTKSLDRKAIIKARIENINHLVS